MALFLDVTQKPRVEVRAEQIKWVVSNAVINETRMGWYGNQLFC